MDHCLTLLKSTSQCAAPCSSSSMQTRGAVNHFVPDAAGSLPNSESRYGLDPESLPSAVKVMAQDQAQWQGKVYVSEPPSPLPPLATTSCCVEDKVKQVSSSASPFSIRATSYCFPCDGQTTQLSHLPLGALISPLAGVNFGQGEAAVLLLAIDVSVQALRGGHLEFITHQICSLLSSLNSVDEDNVADARVGLITYDSRVHLYDLSPVLSRPHMLVLTESDEIQLPISSGLLVPLRDCIDNINRATEIKQYVDISAASTWEDCKGTHRSYLTDVPVFLRRIPALPVKKRRRRGVRSGRIVKVKALLAHSPDLMNYPEKLPDHLRGCFFRLASRRNLAPLGASLAPLGGLKVELAVRPRRFRRRGSGGANLGNLQPLSRAAPHRQENMPWNAAHTGDFYWELVK
ncbi:hypothetical protein WMY93_004439 [Mugilogobius chulae]|uniref:Sec23/Sec24 trunk domain-containing protein n=1 Tax=Mugilogobius chulae TaxID=88201 RepID=A0AAW0PSA8_9GOBI